MISLTIKNTDHKLRQIKNNNKKLKNKAKTDYANLKSKLLKNTFQTGVCLTTFYYFNNSIDNTLSISIGAISSCFYVNLLSKYVDNIQSKPYQLLVPFGYSLFEYIVNNLQDQIHLDFLITCMGFFSYKIPLFYILIDEITVMIDNDINGDKNEIDIK